MATANARRPSATATGGSERHHQPAWRPYQRIVRMNSRARWRAGKEFAQQYAAVVGHERVAYPERTAAGAGQSQRVPIVDDLDIAERHEQVADTSGIARLAEECADYGPARVCAAAGERILSAQSPAARAAFSGRARRQR